MPKWLSNWDFGSRFRLEMERDYHAPKRKRRIYWLYIFGYGWPRGYAVAGYSIRQVRRRLQRDYARIATVNRRIKRYTKRHRDHAWASAFTHLYRDRWPPLYGLGGSIGMKGRTERAAHDTAAEG